MTVWSPVLISTCLFLCEKGSYGLGSSCFYFTAISHLREFLCIMLFTRDPVCPMSQAVRLEKDDWRS